MDLALIRIQERDIYLAFYTLDRIEEIPEDLEIMCQLKLFLNGAVNMIKKKFSDGLEDIKKVNIHKLKECNVELLARSYQAYGNFCLGKVTDALEIYSELERSQKLMEGDTYNLLLCQGILAGEAKKFSEAKSYFDK